MEYSLQALNKLTKLQGLKLQEIVDTLNLIGLEVDNIFYDKSPTNNYIENLRIEIAIPSNREDLLNEKFLLTELSTIFKVEPKNSWDKLKPNYGFILKQKYSQYQNYETKPINTDLTSLLTYSFKLENITNLKTPLWIKTKLKNSIIDLDDLVLVNLINLSVLEWGQQITQIPSTFGSPVNLTRLNESQYFINNNGTQTLLAPGTVVLKNELNEIINVLGLINIKDSLVDSNTCFFEATFYDIQQNNLGLTTINTNLSYRYLRRVFLETFKYSLQRFLTLIELTTNFRIQPIKYKTKSKLQKVQKTKILAIQKQSAKKVLNIDTYNLSIFSQAGLSLICETNTELYFLIPKSRKDLNREIDIIEEYSRFIGYKNFDEIIPKKQLSFFKDTRKSEKLIKQLLLNYGFNEALTNSIYGNQKLEFETIKLKNPLNNELAVLRTTLLPNLINVFETNVRSSNKNLKFFEIGRTFKFFDKKLIEQDKLGAIFHFDLEKNITNQHLEWFQVKGFIEVLLKNFGYENLNFEVISKNFDLFHPTRSILIKKDKIILGVFGEITPKNEKLSGLKQKVYMFELNLTLLPAWKTNSSVIQYKAFSKYPTMIKDISIKIEKKVNLDIVKNVILSTVRNLKRINFFDLYLENQASNYLNVGIRLTFQSTTETLRTEYVEEQIELLLLKLNKEFKVNN
jgi:phenylalanyl-tRNA synthetase beta chain